MAPRENRFTATALFGLALLTANASAQEMSVNPGNYLQAGSTATITYSDPGRANQQITVTVMGGFPVPTVQEVVIQLDAKGNGTGTWTVEAAWRGAHFNAPGVKEIALPIAH